MKTSTEESDYEGPQYWSEDDCFDFDQDELFFPSDEDLAKVSKASSK